MLVANNASCGYKRLIVCVLLAPGAEATKGDFRRFDAEPVMLARGEAGRSADGAGDIFDTPAGCAQEMVVIVSDPRFVACGTGVEFDLPYEPRVTERLEDHIDRLQRRSGENPVDALTQLRDVKVTARFECVKHGTTGGRRAEASVAQTIRRVHRGCDLTLMYCASNHTPSIAFF